VAAGTGAAEYSSPWQSLPVSSKQLFRDFVSGSLRLELEALITSLITKNENDFQRTAT